MAVSGLISNSVLPGCQSSAPTCQADPSRAVLLGAGDGGFRRWHEDPGRALREDAGRREGLSHSRWFSAAARSPCCGLDGRAYPAEALEYAVGHPVERWPVGDDGP